MTAQPPPVAKPQAAPATNARSMQSNADKRKALAKAHMRSTVSLQSSNSGEDDTKTKQQASSSTTSSAAAASLAEKRRRAMSRVGQRAGASPLPEEVPKGPEAPASSTPKSNSLLSKLAKKSMSQNRRSGSFPASPTMGASDSKTAPPSKTINARDTTAMRAVMAAAQHQMKAKEAPLTPNSQQQYRGPMGGGQTPVQHNHPASMNRTPQPPTNMSNQGRMQHPSQYNGVSRSPSASPPSGSPPHQGGGPMTQMGQPRTPVQPPHRSPNPSPPRNSPPQVAVVGGPVPTARSPQPVGNLRAQQAPMMQNPNRHSRQAAHALPKQESDDMSGGPSDEEREDPREEKKEDEPNQPRNTGMKPRGPPPVQGATSPMPMPNQAMRDRSPAPVRVMPGQSPVPIRGMSPGRNFRNPGPSTSSAPTPPRPDRQVPTPAGASDANRTASGVAPPPPPPPPSFNTRARSPSPFGPRVRARSPSPSVVSTASHGSSVMGRVASSRQSAVVVSQPIGQPDLGLLSPKDEDGMKRSSELGDEDGHEEEPNRSPPRIIHQRRQRSKMQTPGGPTTGSEPTSTEETGQAATQSNQRPTNYTNQAQNGHSIVGNRRAVSQPPSMQHNHAPGMHNPNTISQGGNPHHKQFNGGPESPSMRGPRQSNSHPMRPHQPTMTNNGAVARSPSAPRAVQQQGTGQPQDHQESGVERSLPMADGRATLEIPRAASVSRFKAQFERPGNVALIPDKTLLQNQTRTPSSMNSNGAPVQGHPGSQTRKWTPNRNGMGQGQPDAQNQGMQNQAPRPQANLPGQDSASVQVPVQGNDRAVIETPRRVNVANMAGRFQQASPGQSYNHANAPQTRNFSPSPNNRWRQSSPSPNQRNVDQMSPASVGGRSQGHIAAGSPNGGQNWPSQPVRVQASPGRMQGAQQQTRWNGPQGPMPHATSSVGSPMHGQMPMQSPRRQYVQGDVQQQPVEDDPVLVQALSDDPSSLVSRHNQIPPSARMISPSRSAVDFRRPETELTPPDLSLAADSISAEQNESMPLSSGNLKSPSQAERLAARERAGTIQHSFTADGALPPMNRASNPKQNRSRAAAQPLPAQARSKDAYNELQKKLMKRQQDIETTSVASTPMMQNLTAEVARATAVVMNKNERPTQNHTHHDQSQVSTAIVQGEMNSNAPFAEHSTPIKKEDSNGDSESAKGSPNLVQLAADSIHAIDYDQESYDALRSRSPSMETDHPQSAIPDESSLPPEFVSSASNSQRQEQQGARVTPPPPHLMQQNRQSEYGPPVGATRMDGGEVLGDPKSFGTAGSEDPGHETPTVADRAKAIAMWKGGKGPKPKTADLVERPKSGDSNDYSQQAAGNLSDGQRQMNEKGPSVDDHHFWNSSSDQEFANMPTQGASIKPGADTNTKSTPDPFSPSAVVGFKESSNASRTTGGFDPFTATTGTTNSDDSGFPSGGFSANDDGFGFGNVNNFGDTSGFEQNKKNASSNGTAFSESTGTGFSDPFVASRENAFPDDFVASAGFSSGSGSDPFTEPPMKPRENTVTANNQGHNKTMMLKPNKGDSSSGAAARRRSRGTPRSEDKIFGSSNGLMIDDGFGAQPPANALDDGFGIPTKKSHSFGNKNKGFTMTSTGDDGFGGLDDGFLGGNNDFQKTSNQKSFSRAKPTNDDGFGFSSTDFGGSQKANDPSDDLFMPSSSSSEKPDSGGFPTVTGSRQAKENVVLRPSNRDSSASQPNLDHFYSEASDPVNTWSFGTGIESSFFDKHKTREAAVIPATIGEEV